MEDKFITTDTLNMLSQKGFNYYHFPTQSLAQKWLRETNNLHISIIRNACGYGYDICKADNGTHITDGIFKVLTMAVSGKPMKKHWKSEYKNH